LRNLGARVDEKFVSGSAFDKLVKAAVRSHARLIVVGAVGQRLARRLLVGSVAERTAETSPVPTLVVRPGGRLLSWIRGRHRLKVLAGYDFSAASDAALGWVNQLRELGKLQTSVLYSSWPPDEARRLGGAARLPLPVNPEQIQENLDRDLRQRVAKFFPGEKAATIVEPGWGNPEGHLFEMASREHVDLLVVGTRRRRGAGRFLLGSVSRAVLHHAKMSVAVIPADTAARKSAA
jgi:nucleotide-binding universal stress UspA family protein